MFQTTNYCGDNKGMEFLVSNRNRFGKFGVDVTLNLAINTNKVVNLAGTGPFYYGTDQNPRYTIQEGYPIYSFWGYKTSGFYQTDADAAAGRTLGVDRHGQLGCQDEER